MKAVLGSVGSGKKERNYFHELRRDRRGDDNGALAYDTNGNMRQYDGWTYVYDAQNRLTSAVKQGTVALFAYDGKNRQIMRSINTTVVYSVWDGWELIEEYGLEDSIVPTATYLQGAHGPVKAWINGHVVYYYQDSLGSTTHIADAGGNLLESYRYDLYGTPSYYEGDGQPKNTETSDYGITDLYAGERWIGELKLYDLRNRFMSPELGRFLQADPIGFKGDASNLYRYCHNDPEDFTDPMGLVDTSAIQSYSRLTSFGGGDWIKGSAGLSALDLKDRLPAGNITVALTSIDQGGTKDNGKKSAQQQASEMLRQEVRGTTDQTGAIGSKIDARGKDGPPYPVGPVAGRLQERVKGSPAFGYTMEKEHLPMHDGVRTVIIVHYHSRGGKEARPTADDWAMVRQERAPMYFSSRELARTGNYIILRQDGSKEQRFDALLKPP